MHVDQTYTAPQDRGTLARLGDIARTVAKAHGLALQVLEAKRRPAPGAAGGLCYVAQGRVALLVRHRQAGAWWKRPTPWADLVRTLGHELAHLVYPNHGPEFRALESVLVAACQAADAAGESE